jgi:hypothetical protein
VSLDPRGFLKVVHNTAVVAPVDFDEVLEKHRELAKSRRVPVLVDARLVSSMSHAARSAAASSEVAALTSRVGILVNGPVSTIIGNFFIRVSHPLVPTRLFTDRFEAEEWLTQPVSP